MDEKDTGTKKGIYATVIIILLIMLIASNVAQTVIRNDAEKQWTVETIRFAMGLVKLCE